VLPVVASDLHARALTRRYGGGGINDLGLSVESGNVVGVAGPNGAGKSTALGLLATRVRASHGSLYVAGVDARRRPRSARRLIGYLAHQPPLYEDMRVIDFLAHAARLYGIPRQQLNASVERAGERSGLADSLRRRIRHLSAGFRRRVGLAQALIHDPPVLVLDEPTTGLDTEATRHFWNQLAPLAEGRVIIIASHLFAELDALCHRLVILRAGEVVSDHALEPNDPSNNLLVRLRDEQGESPSIEALGLTSVESVGRGVFRVRDADAATQRRLMATILERGWSVAEWYPEQRGSEQLYRAAVESIHC
jgi:ABC-2 type transport system ATP-binding protein